MVVPPILAAILNHFIQSAQFAGTSVKFDPVYHKAVSFNVDFKATVLAKKLFPAYYPQLRVAEWAQRKILHPIRRISCCKPSSVWFITKLLYYKCKYAMLLFNKKKGIINQEIIILFIFYDALVDPGGNIHLRSGGDMRCRPSLYYTNANLTSTSLHHFTIRRILWTGTVFHSVLSCFG